MAFKRSAVRSCLSPPKGAVAECRRSVTAFLHPGIESHGQKERFCADILLSVCEKTAEPKVCFGATTRLFSFTLFCSAPFFYSALTCHSGTMELTSSVLLKMAAGCVKITIKNICFKGLIRNAPQDWISAFEHAEYHSVPFDCPDRITNKGTAHRSSSAGRGFLFAFLERNRKNKRPRRRNNHENNFEAGSFSAHMPDHGGGNAARLFPCGKGGE